MLHFIPAFGSKKIANESADFIKENFATFLRVFKPLAPYIGGLVFLDALVNSQWMPEGKTVSIGGLAANYFLACLVISWHRVVILGKDHTVAVNPLKPTKNELIFMGTALLVFFIPMIIGVTFSFISDSADNFVTAALIGLIASLMISVLAYYKFAFFFPAKATGHKISFLQSMKMTKGYIEKIISTSIRAISRLVIKMIVFAGIGILAAKVLKVLIKQPALDPHIDTALYDFIFPLAFALYFLPLIIITGVTVLSHYYQCALNDKGMTP